MKQIPVSDLIPGMVTAEDVLTYDLRPYNTCSQGHRFN